MNDSIHFFVPGEPQSKGSMKGFPFRKGNGKLGVSMTNSNPKTTSWESLVASEAAKVAVGFPEEGVGYSVSLHFYRTKPKSMGKKKNLWLTKKDLDKMCRNCLDGMTGIVFPDDSMVVELHAMKFHADHNYDVNHHKQPGVSVTISKVREVDQ
jgi:crossover junction endodeoxyribonuclease RusA